MAVTTNTWALVGVASQDRCILFFISERVGTSKQALVMDY